MLHIKYINDSTLKFLNPNSNSKTQWYYSDMVKGDKVPVVEVVRATNKTLYFQCLDGEIGIVPLSDIVFMDIHSN